MNENPLTNLSEVNADFVRLFDRTEKKHRDIKDIFVDKQAITEASIVDIPIGPDEVETQLEYIDPTNDQVPALASLLEYIQQVYPSAPIHKYFNINRRHLTIRDGDVHLNKTTRVARIARRSTVQRDDHHVYLKTVKQQNRHQHVTIDVFSPHYYQKYVKHVKVVRPIVIFSEHM